MQIEFDFSQMDKLADDMHQAGTEARVTLDDGLLRIAKLFVTHNPGSGPLADETPKRTGKLARSTVAQVMGGQEVMDLEIRQSARSEAGDFYGWFVREGTRPHIIRPRNKKALKFEVGGEVIFATLVHHPGTKANPYHVRVFNRLSNQVEEIVRKMGAKLTAHLSGGT